jgi:hypothetical protein
MMNLDLVDPEGERIMQQGSRKKDWADLARANQHVQPPSNEHDRVVNFPD